MRRRTFLTTLPAGALAAGAAVGAPAQAAQTSTESGQAGQGAADWQMKAVTLAVVSGAVTSGLGYALWYTVLPRLPGSVAAVAQLTVPLIAMAGGMAFLAEPLTLRFSLAALLVLGGVAVSIVTRRPRAG